MSNKSDLKRKKCAKCGKSLKRVAWYYRNNNYFCGKGCFAAHDKKAKSEKAAAKQAEKTTEAKAE